MNNYDPVMPSSGGIQLSSNFKLYRNGLQIFGEPLYEDWQRCGEILRTIQGAIQFAIGDWLNYGERRWGEMYSQAIDATEYTMGALANMKYVAGRIESSRRHEKLDYTHHQEVAALEPAKQDEFLQKAEAQNWSTRRLREEIRAQKAIPRHVQGKPIQIWKFEQAPETFQKQFDCTGDWLAFVPIELWEMTEGEINFLEDWKEVWLNNGILLLKEG